MAVENGINLMIKLLNKLTIKGLNKKVLVDNKKILNLRYKNTKMPTFFYIKKINLYKNVLLKLLSNQNKMK